MSERVDVVRRLFAAVEARDLATVLDCYGDRVEIHEMPSLPYGGVYRGRRGARDHAEAFFRAWGPVQLRREPLEASFGETDDERVVVLFRHRAGDEGRNVWLDEQEVGIYEVRDGLIERSSMVHPDPERLVRFLAARSARVTRSTRCGPVAGLLLCLLWAPMALVVPRFPDLGGEGVVTGFWSTDLDLMRAVVLSVSVGYLFLVVFLGALAARLGADPEVRVWSYTAVGAALMFTTALNVAIGLVMAAGLVAATDPSGAYALHVGGFVLAAPAAFAGVAFFVAWRSWRSTPTSSPGGRGGSRWREWAPTRVRSVVSAP